MIDFKDILEYDRLARQDGEMYPKKRFLFSELELCKGKHFTGIVGPRGVGKTILLKQLALKHKHSLYISLDTIQGDLFALAKRAKEDFNIEILLLDEVHFHADFDKGLKKIYDYLKLDVIFTSSVSLALFESQYDLSRRVLLKKLYPFSFREYIYFKYDAEFKGLSIGDILNKQFDRGIFSYMNNFYDYLQGGIFPFAINESFALELLKNIRSTVIRKDIPRVTDVTVSELDIIEKVLSFIGASAIDGINYSSIACNCGITKYKAEQYVRLLEKAFILHQVFPKGTNVLKEPKVLMALPYRMLYSDFQHSIGGLREDFFVEVMRSFDKDIYYLKTTRGKKTPDYAILYQGKDLVVEIGGRGKGIEQFKGFELDKKIIAADADNMDNIRRPLFLFGFLI